MGHRQLHPSPASEMNHVQVRNLQIPHSHLHSENAPVVLPSNNLTATGMNSWAYSDVGPRPDVHIPSQFGACPHYGAASGTSHQSSMNDLPAGSSSQFPNNYAHHGSSYYHGIMEGSDVSTANAHLDSRLAGFKRKSPSMPLVFDKGSTSGHHSDRSLSGFNNYNGGNSPILPLPSSCMPAQTGAPHLMSIGPSYRNNDIPVSGEGSQRNVRSCYSLAPCLEVNQASLYSLSTESHNLYPNQGVSGLGIAGQSSQTPVSMTPHRRIFSAGSSITNSPAEICVAHHSNSNQNINQTVLLPTYYEPSTRGMGPGHSVGDRRISHGTSSGYPIVGFSATSSEERRQSVVEAIGASQHFRPLSIEGRSSERTGRARNFYSRHQSSRDDGNAYTRGVPQGVVTLDRYYDPWSFLDQHSDMRLDIDNMSYEELLALEERIGNVSTGLSEDTISKCLAEKMYFTPGHIEDDHLEAKCSICLEDYEDCDYLGKLKCRHEFHFSCIKKWLQIKNVCPICKTSAVSDTRKEKQKMPS